MALSHRLSLDCPTQGCLLKTRIMSKKSVASDEKQLSPRVLHRVYIFHPHNMMMSSLTMQVEAQQKMLESQGYKGRQVMGFKLPEWQRPAVWSDEQSERFIESVFLGVGLGTYMVNLSMKNSMVDLVLVDGQQRMRAIERYLASEFAVRGEDGNKYVWGELTDAEQAHFFRMPFAWNESSYHTEAEVREAYNRHNFGGVAHDPSQRA